MLRELKDRGGLNLHVVEMTLAEFEAGLMDALGRGCSPCYSPLFPSLPERGSKPEVTSMTFC